MDTKDAEWLGVWHSITELPVASVRWAQTGSESKKKKKTCQCCKASHLQLTVLVILTRLPVLFLINPSTFEQ